MNRILKFRKVIQSDLEKFPLWYERIKGNQLFTHFIPSTYNSYEKSKSLPWFIILLNDDEEIGTIWFKQKDEMIEEYDLGIYLNHEKYFGKTIGKDAIRQAIDTLAPKMDMKEVFLNVRKNNQRAVKCYKDLGFTVIHDGEVLFGSKKIEFFRMRLDIEG